MFPRPPKSPVGHQIPYRSNVRPGLCAFQSHPREAFEYFLPDSLYYSSFSKSFYFSSLRPVTLTIYQYKIAHCPHKEVAVHIQPILPVLPRVSAIPVSFFDNYQSPTNYHQQLTCRSTRLSQRTGRRITAPTISAVPQFAQARLQSRTRSWRNST
jgi:hypothetical protein